MTAGARLLDPLAAGLRERLAIHRGPGVRAAAFAHLAGPHGAGLPAMSGRRPSTLVTVDVSAGGTAREPGSG